MTGRDRACGVSARAARWVALAALAVPRAGHAGGLDLSWDACAGVKGARNATAFACGVPSDEPRLLLAGFELDSALSRVVAVDVTLDIMAARDSVLPPFWYFQVGGCNTGGVAALDGIPASGCDGWSGALCGRGGGACDALVTAYGVQYGGPNRARLLLTLARASSDPVALAASPARHFAFALSFSPGDRAGACVGCDRSITVEWVEAVFHEVDADGRGRVVARLSGADSGSRARACANAGECEPIPPLPPQEPAPADAPPRD